MKATNYLNCLIVSACLITTLHAQDNQVQDNQLILTDDIQPKIVSDQAMSQRLQKDWNKRNSKIQSVPVEWFEMRDGFYGTYTSNNQLYRSLYDANGNYIETLKKSEWNSKVPAPVKSSFDLSNYKSQKVTSYWEVLNASQKVYYLELTDEQGKISRLWANEKGDFSTTAPKLKSKQ